MAMTNGRLNVRSRGRQKKTTAPPSLGEPAEGLTSTREAIADVEKLEITFTPLSTITKKGSTCQHLLAHSTCSTALLLFLLIGHNFCGDKQLF